LRLLNNPVDIVVGQTGRDDTRPQCASGSIVIVMRSSGSRPSLREIGGDLADSRFDHFAFRSHEADGVKIVLVDHGPQ
jgi:hypothetical protein